MENIEYVETLTLIMYIRASMITWTSQGSYPKPQVFLMIWSCTPRYQSRGMPSTFGVSFGNCKIGACHLRSISGPILKTYLFQVTVVQPTKKNRVKLGMCKISFKAKHKTTKQTPPMVFSPLKTITNFFTKKNSRQNSSSGIDPSASRASLPWR